MLRRVGQRASNTASFPLVSTMPLTSSSLVSGPSAIGICLRQTRFFSTTLSLRRGVDKEEQEELERERQLREKFERKMQGGGGGGQPPKSFGDMWQQVQQVAQQAQQQAQQQQKQGSSAESTGTAGSSQQATGTNPWANAGWQQGAPKTMSFWDIVFYTTTLYAVFILWQFEKEGSALNRFSGVNWWAEPIDVVVNYLITRVCLPLSEQRKLKGEYERIARTHPKMTYTAFLKEYHPGIFDGHQTRHEELVAAMCACFAFSNDLRFVDTMKRSVGMGRDIKQSIDNIMDALKREYPHVFAPSSGGMTMGGPPAAGYGGGYAPQPAGGQWGNQQTWGSPPPAGTPMPGEMMSSPSQYNFSSAPSFDSKATENLGWDGSKASSSSPSPAQ